MSPLQCPPRSHFGSLFTQNLYANTEPKLMVVRQNPGSGALAWRWPEPIAAAEVRLWTAVRLWRVGVTMKATVSNMFRLWMPAFQAGFPAQNNPLAHVSTGRGGMWRKQILPEDLLNPQNRKKKLR